MCVPTSRAGRVVDGAVAVFHRACALTPRREDKYDDAATLTLAERVEMVWELTKRAWAFKDPSFHESRLRRDIARVVRSRR
jgi:hypothetical protein